jgi:hypothetical protein
MGTHISTVRSTSLDEWTPQQITSIQGKGNALINSSYEANMGKTQKIQTQSDDRSREDYIRSKYERKLFYGLADSTPQEDNLQIEEVVEKKKTKPKQNNPTPKKVEKVEVVQPKKVQKEEPSMIDFFGSNEKKNDSTLQQLVFQQDDKINSFETKNVTQTSKQKKKITFKICWNIHNQKKLKRRVTLWLFLMKQSYLLQFNLKL